MRSKSNQRLVVLITGVLLLGAFCVATSGSSLTKDRIISESSGIAADMDHQHLESGLLGHPKNLFNRPLRTFDWVSISVGDVLMKGKTTGAGGCVYPSWSIETPRKRGMVRSTTFRSVAVVCELVVVGKKEEPLSLTTQLNRSNALLGQLRTVSPIIRKGTSSPLSSLLYSKRSLMSQFRNAAWLQCTPGSSDAHSDWFGIDPLYQDVFEIHSHLEYDYDCSSVTKTAGYGNALGIAYGWGGIDAGDYGSTYNEHDGSFWTNYDSGYAWAIAYGTVDGSYEPCYAGSSGFQYTDLYQNFCY